MFSGKDLDSAISGDLHWSPGEIGGPRADVGLTLLCTLRNIREEKLIQKIMSCLTTPVRNQIAPSAD